MYRPVCQGGSTENASSLDFMTCQGQVLEKASQKRSVLRLAFTDHQELTEQRTGQRHEPDKGNDPGRGKVPGMNIQSLFRKQ